MSTSNDYSSPADGYDSYVEEESDGLDGVDLLQTIWRYKMVLLLCLLTGLGAGFAWHRQKPTMYAAGMQLMIRSDNPLVLDTNTGNLIGGVPDIEVLTSLVQSDRIILPAASDPVFGNLNGGDLAGTAGQLREKLAFGSPQKNQSKTDRLITSLSVEDSDPEFCVHAVEATVRAIEDFFHKEQESSVNGLSALISKAEQRLLPQLEKLEEDYRAFRSRAELAWSSEGEVVNPHRERQSILRAQELELENQRRRLFANFQLIDSTWKREKDLGLVIQMINQIDGSLAMPKEETELVSTQAELSTLQSLQQEEADVQLVRDLEIRDLELESLQVEETLVPLEVQLQRQISEYGRGHPAVKSLSQQVEATRKKLNSLASQRQQRVEKLRLEQERILEERIKAREGEEGNGIDEIAAELESRRRKYVVGFGNALKQRINLIDQQIAEIRTNFETEKRLANQLVQAETDDAMYRRQIESVRGQLIQLEDQMSGLKISEVNKGIVVEPLMASVAPMITGPNLGKDLAISGLLGLGLGSLLAFLLESNARMFRNGHQLANDLGLAVVAHIPVDRKANTTKGSVATGTAAELHSNLSVVHRPESAVSEAIRCMRTNLLFDANNHDRKVYQVTSPLPGDGKSTITANLAASLAQSGRRTLLIDLDLRSPRLTRRFKLEEEMGITNLLNGECDPRSVAHSTGVDNLDMCPSGALPSNPAEALLLPEMGEVMDWFRDHYDFVIVDTPPLLLVTDPAITTKYVDSVILGLTIIRQCKPNAKEAIAILRSAGANVMGIAVNKVDEVTSGGYYQMGSDGGYGNVGYGYGKEYRKERLAKTGEVEYEVKGRQRASRDPETADING